MGALVTHLLTQALRFTRAKTGSLQTNKQTLRKVEVSYEISLSPKVTEQYRSTNITIFATLNLS